IGESNLLKGSVSGSSDRDQQFVLESGISVTVAARNGGTASADEEAVLMLRPEHLSPCAEPSGNDDTRNVLRATVVESVYLGNVSRYRLRMLDGTYLVMRLSGSTPKLGIGETVAVGFAAENAVLIPSADQNRSLNALAAQA